ncbi:MAG: hypothetical protein ABJA34_10630 [Pseudonocardiales bacterium]
MTTRRCLPGIMATALLLAGCGSNRSATTPPTAADQSMSGMSMARGQTMPSTPRATSAAPQGPSATAQMVCGDDIRAKVNLALGLKTPAPVQSSYQDHLYTCTYRLPVGPLVLSVQQSTSKITAAAYFNAVRRELTPTTPLKGLGERASATVTGTVIVIKDNLTLRVDATALPTVFGTQKQKRTDLAYEMASAVLGCWTGDE